MTDTVFELMVDIQNALEDSDDEPPSASAPGAAAPGDAAPGDAAPGDAAPGDESLTSWAQQAYLSVADEDSEVTIRLVGEAEMAELNKTYRNKDGTTNVLSFPVDAEIEIPLLGDIVICHQVIVREAHEQNKNLHDHYAHMVTHGVLHLCGYDHNNDAEAEEMEALEVDVLAQSNIANPYN